MKKVLSLFLVLIILIACKKNQSSNEDQNVVSEFAFVIRNSPLYKKTDIESQILSTIPEGAKLEVMDDPNRNFWKVSYGGKIGFIPRTFYTEIKENFLSIFYQIEESDHHIVITDKKNLRLRERPFLDAKVITSLEKNRKVFVLAVGRLFQKIDSSFDVWYLVKTENGEIGFIYGGFTHKNYPSIKIPFLNKNPLWMDVKNSDAFVA